MSSRQSSGMTCSETIGVLGMILLIAYMVLSFCASYSAYYDCLAEGWERGYFSFTFSDDAGFGAICYNGDSENPTEIKPLEEILMEKYFPSEGEQK